MRHPLFAALAAALAIGVTGCGADPSDALRVRFKTSIPNDVRVDHFYQEPFDASRAIWDLSPVRQEFLDALIAGGSLQRAEEGKAIARPRTAGFPEWWPEEHVRSLSEMYYRNPGVGDENILQVWVDREADKIYVLFVDPHPEPDR